MSSSSTQYQNLGAVVLCGGKSARLGIDKTQLLFREKTFLEHVVEKVAHVASHVVLVGNIDFSNHNLPKNVILDEDKMVGKGPLEGMRVGLERLHSADVEFGFVTSCDVPLLKPDLIRHLFALINDRTCVVPVDEQRVYGMTAIYRSELHVKIGDRIQSGQLRVSELANEFDALQPTVDSLRTIDPELDSMTNVNSKQDYLNLLGRFDHECPPHLLAAIEQQESD